MKSTKALRRGAESYTRTKEAEDIMHRDIKVLIWIMI